MFSDIRTKDIRTKMPPNLLNAINPDEFGELR
jgi:hypothetical protein